MVADRADAAQLGQVIRKHREGRLTQTQLGDAIGLDQTSVSAIERGARWPSIEQITAIEDVLGLRPGTLLRESGLAGDPLDVAGSTADLSGLTETQAEAVRRMVDEFHRANRG